MVNAPVAQLVDGGRRKGAGKGAGADEQQQHLQQADKVEDGRLRRGWGGKRRAVGERVRECNGERGEERREEEK